MSLFRRLLYGVAVVVGLVIGSTARADIISVQFGVGGTLGGPALLPTDIAGVVPASNWNVAVGDSGSTGLVNNAGLATGASVSWSSNNTWSHGPSGFTPGSGNDKLMTSYLDGESNGVPATATFTGLSGSSYNVYMYSADAQETVKQSGGFFVNGVHVPGSGDGSVGGPTFIQTSPGVTGNYLLLKNVAPVGGVISITDDGTSFRIPLNGVELVQSTLVPEPATLSLLAAGALAVGGSGAFARWRRRRLMA
jgi:hypothetical protein